MGIRGWIIVYNTFQYWINRAKRKFADIDVLMQERIDNIHVLAQIAKKYDIHEYKARKVVPHRRALTLRAAKGLRPFGIPKAVALCQEHWERGT